MSHCAPWCQVVVLFIVVKRLYIILIYSSFLDDFYRVSTVHAGQQGNDRPRECFSANSLPTRSPNAADHEATDTVEISGDDVEFQYKHPALWTSGKCLRIVCLEI